MRTPTKRDTNSGLPIPAEPSCFKPSGRGIVKLKLACPSSEANGPCAGSLSLATAKAVKVKGKKRRFQLARADFSVPAGATKKVRLKFGKSVMKLLRTNPPARLVKVTAEVEDGIGNRATVRKNLKAKGLS